MPGEKIAVVGAGPVGSLCALMLADRFPSAHISLFDARPDPRLPGSVSSGRSINLAFSHRGVAAIESVDPALVDRVIEQGVVMRGRMLHKGRGELEPQDYGLYEQGEFLRSVSRTAVNAILLDGVDANDRIELKWETKLLEMDLRGAQGVELTFGTKDGARKTRRFDWVVGADGAYSMTRRQMMRAPKSRFDFSQTYAEHDYMEFTMPASLDGKYKMPEPYLHIWPRKKHMLIALPNQDGSFTMTLFAPHELFEEMRRPVPKGEELRIVKLFREEFPDALELICVEGVTRCWQDNPIDGLITTRVGPHHFDGRVLLLGDASHAMVPFYGQGMNCGLEDVRVLAALIDAHLGRPAKLPDSSLTPPLSSFKLDTLQDVFEAYSTVRIPSTSAMQRFAHHNYTEMAASVLDPLYLVRRAIDMTLARMLPAGRWDSLYRMVTFRPNIAYEEVEKRRDQQTKVLKNVVRGVVAASVLGLSTLSFQYARYLSRRR